MLSVADENVATERFIGGEFSILAVPATRQEDFRTDENLQEFPRYEFTGNGFTFFGMNHANPANPQPGLGRRRQSHPAGAASSLGRQSWCARRFLTRSTWMR